jgi:hypothetical protein
MPLTKRMAVILRVRRCAVNSMPCCRYCSPLRSRHVDCYLPSSGFREWSGMDLATLDTWAQTQQLSPKGAGTARAVREWGDGEPNSSHVSQYPAPQCWVELDYWVFQNQSEPFSLRRDGAGNTVITVVGRACWSYRSEDFPKQFIRPCGGSSRAPVALVPPPIERKSQDFGLTTVWVLLFPLAFCLTIDPRLGTKSDRTDGWNP